MSENPVNSGQNPQVYPDPQYTQPVAPADAPVEQPETMQPQDSVSEPVAPTPEQPPIPPAQPTSQESLPLPNEDDRPLPEQVIMEWQAPSRPFKKRNRQYYTTIGIIVFLICMILFFAGQFLPIAVVIAVAFLAYVLSAVPPERVLNRITTYGIRTDDNLYYWDELGRFWLDTKYGQRLVHFETTRFPGQISLVLTDQDEAELIDILGTVLVNETPPLGSFDKAAQWLQDKVPLDTEA